MHVVPSIETDEKTLMMFVWMLINYSCLSYLKKHEITRNVKDYVHFRLMSVVTSWWALWRKYMDMCRHLGQVTWGGNMHAYSLIKYRQLYFFPYTHSALEYAYGPIPKVLKRSKVANLKTWGTKS